MDTLDDYPCALMCVSSAYTGLSIVHCEREHINFLGIALDTVVCQSTKSACFTIVIRATSFPVIATALVEL